MKILVTGQHYAPEPFRLPDICQALCRRGHELLVVTGEPNYPEGALYPGYEGHRVRWETLGGVRVRRCYTVPRGRGVLRRGINYYSYALSSTRFARSARCAARGGAPFDAVLVYQTSPVMMAYPGMAYKEKQRVPLLLYCLDLWPECLTAGGVSRQSPLFRYYHGVSRLIYRSADRILAASSLMIPYFRKRFDIPKERLSYFPQYAEAIFDTPPAPERSDGKKRFVFAGNIGYAQGLDVVLGAAERLRKTSAVFELVGAGTDLERLRRLAVARRLDNVLFRDRMPVEEMPKLYANASAMLVTLRPGQGLGYMLPGKVQAAMLAGKPIIAAAEGETERVIRQSRCGYCGPPGDADALARNIGVFMEMGNPALLGDNARRYAKAHFGKQAFLDRLEALLEEVCGS